MSTHSVLRYEAALKVTGSAVYEAEVPAPGMLHAALVEAPISCGDVLSVDAKPAIDLPGFAAMVSYAPIAEVLQSSPATALIRERAHSFCGPARRACHGKHPSGCKRSSDCTTKLSLHRCVRR